MSLGRLKATWEDLGRVDPLWAVLSDPSRRHGRWDVNDFMATGTEQVDWMAGVLREHELGFGERVLDFGCGVGRLTNALAERVPEAVGVDIAESMVEHATQMARHPERTRFVSYDGKTLPFEDGSFGSAVSLIVLQHARPAVQIACLLELQRVVRVGGALLLQIPSHPKKTAALEAEAMRAGIHVEDAPSVLTAATSATVRTVVTNLSPSTWPAGRQVKLGNHWSGENLSIQDDGRVDLPHAVAPGESVRLDLLVTAPSVPGRYELQLDMVQEFVSWWQDAGSLPAVVEVEVRPGAVAQPTPRMAAVASVPVPEAVAHVELPSTMEMHGLHVNLVLSLFEHCGSKVVAVLPDNCAGPEWESFSYVVRRLS
jgi:ubiquinone/menaquinone biosynthesis C-methylase UbiE